MSILKQKLLLVILSIQWDICAHNITKFKYYTNFLNNWIQPSNMQYLRNFDNINRSNSQCQVCQKQDDSKTHNRLNCGHKICTKCMKKMSRFQIVVMCSICNTMSYMSHVSSMIKNENQNSQNIQKQQPANSQYTLYCLQCENQIISMQSFLKGNHRTHKVCSVSQISQYIDKKLIKQKISLDAELNVMYKQIQALSRQKRQLSQQYITACQQIKLCYGELKQTIQESQLRTIRQYQQIALKQIQCIDQKLSVLRNNQQQCDSYIQSIDELTNTHKNYNQNARKIQKSQKQLTCLQFYIDFDGYLSFFNSQLSKNRLGQDQNIKIKLKKLLQPNYKQIKNIINDVESLKLFFYEQPQKQVFNVSSREKYQKQIQKNKSNKIETKQIIKSRVSPKFKTKQHEINQIQQYFEQKRKEIFEGSDSEQNIYQTSRISNNPLQFANSQVNSVQPVSISNRSRSIPQKQTIETYDINGRIQNLRKTLKLVGEQKIDKSTRKKIGFLKSPIKDFHDANYQSNKNQSNILQAQIYRLRKKLNKQELVQ